MDEIKPSCTPPRASSALRSYTLWQGVSDDSGECWRMSLKGAAARHVSDYPASCFLAIGFGRCLDAEESGPPVQGLNEFFEVCQTCYTDHILTCNAQTLIIHYTHPNVVPSNSFVPDSGLPLYVLSVVR